MSYNEPIMRSHVDRRVLDLGEAVDQKVRDSVCEYTGPVELLQLLGDAIDAEVGKFATQKQDTSTLRLQTKIT